VKTIAIYLGTGREQGREVAAEVVRMARAAGLAIAVTGDDDPSPVRDLATSGARVADAELVVTVGGDGTLLRGVRLAVPLDIPLIGVNTGRLGFLTEVETTGDGLRVLEAVFAGTFAIEERVALEASVNGAGAHFALNDVVIRRATQARMAPFGLALDGELIADIPSDGIVVSTPTGSTAYFLSAGGPIISPNVDAFGIAALLPHTLFARPLIVPTSSTVKITCDSEIAHANLEVDGAIVADLKPGDGVTIVRAPRSVKFARTRPRAFFARLEEKLQWGVPIKRNG
jgi:NAD+ kinase